jgi:hypothetical protein
MMFLDCPAYLHKECSLRCGLPAEVRYRFILRSTGGPLESAMISCPSGHWFNGPIESLTLSKEKETRPGQRWQGIRGSQCYENRAALSSGGSE